jgi:hypothetical protein
MGGMARGMRRIPHTTDVQPAYSLRTADAVRGRHWKLRVQQFLDPACRSAQPN